MDRASLPAFGWPRVRHLFCGFILDSYPYHWQLAMPEVPSLRPVMSYHLEVLGSGAGQNSVTEH